MNLRLLILLIFIISGCKKDDVGSKRVIENFELSFQNKGTIKYDNKECDFDNRNNQAQYTFTAVSNSSEPKAYVLASNYRNLTDMDSVQNEIWIDFIVEYSNDQTSFSESYLTSLLQAENSNENVIHLYPHLGVSICGMAYNNDQVEFNSSESVFKLNDKFEYTINDYEVLYKSSCLDEKLLFIDITMKGMLYNHSFQTKIDSLYLNESGLKLLFDIE